MVSVKIDFKKRYSIAEIDVLFALMSNDQRIELMSKFCSGYRIWVTNDEIWLKVRESATRPYVVALIIRSKGNKEWKGVACSENRKYLERWQKTNLLNLKYDWRIVECFSQFKKKRIVKGTEMMLFEIT